MSLTVLFRVPKGDYNPLDSDAIELEIENSGPEAVLISRAYARFDWGKSHPYYRDVSVEIEPGQKATLPPLGFRMDLIAEEGSHLVEFGVKQKVLRENTWSEAEDVWFVPGAHFMLSASAPSAAPTNTV